MSTDWRALSHLLRRIRTPLIIGLSLEVIASLCLLTPLVVAVFTVSHLAGGKPLTDPVWPLGLAAAAVIIGGIARSASTLVLHRADNRLQLHIRRDLLTNVRHSPLETVDRAGGSRIKQIVTDHVDALHHVIAHAIGNALSALVLVLAGLALLIWVAPLATVALAPLIAAVVLSRRQRRGMGPHMREYQAASHDLDRASVEFVQGITALKVFHYSETGLSRFRSAAQRWATFVESWARRVTPSMTAQQVLLSPIAVAAFASITLLLPQNQAATTLLAAMVLIPAMMSPLWSLAFALWDITTGADAARTIEETLRECPSPTEGNAAASTLSWPSGPVSLHASAVSVRLGERDILRDINLTCPATATTVITGPSGAGKTLLLEVLTGLRPTHTGIVSINETPLTSLQPQLNDHVSALWQRPRILRGTVAENIALGRPGTDIEACQRVAREADIHDRLQALPQGYDTMLGEGIDLSGGELQRLCLARALLAEPTLIVLDEPTASIDRESAWAIDKALRNLANRCTVIRVDHRLDVVMSADHVIVIDEGRVAEAGKPDQLAAGNGTLASLIDSQTAVTTA
ncbi:ABC transporter ATP-binding protein [Natronoglycomyces albus]|uniref:ABC transporter ATP-binding protein n=1 Tax=Natronoglycomyces albus TaxID=2811108 RepID=A0A895XLW7_9ACTN|nr:ABC transporter ATP-binding protein [Natronoglycomyces albus]QSB06681.1 ABC transporter ATP-binding protein [Natronoglycomyces albus]